MDKPMNVIANKQMNVIASQSRAQHILFKELLKKNK
jgi:hypothetical protein